MKRLIKWMVPAIMALVVLACGNNKPKEEGMEKAFADFIAKFEEKVVPVYTSAGKAYFDAAVSGKEEDYKKASEFEIELSNIFSDTADFAFLKKAKESNMIKNPMLKRELDVVYNAFLSNQIPKEKLEAMIMLSSSIEEKYSTHRAMLNGEKVNDNQIEEILRTSTNTEELKAAWEASQEIGSVVEKDVRKIVKMRNEVAVSLGFSNYHEMSLSLNDQNPEEVSALFDELDVLTKDAFAELKDEMDTYFASRYGVKKEDLMPWHYQNRFFQEGPRIYEVDLDKYYKDKNLEGLTLSYYQGIGLDITDIIDRSDLYEKPGKNQHAFCTHIDRSGDVRVLCNIKPNSYWMNTMLHEYGHAVYDKYLDMELPFALREPAHTFTTEAIAMLFGRFASNPQWLKDVVGISEEEKNLIAEDCIKTLRLEQLVFSRWAQVMYRFEKSMYENPDQDLNALWWQLKEEYQLLKKPEGRNQPDYCAKIHIATSPCYYHNYLLGELLASQLYYYINTNVIDNKEMIPASFAGKKEVGEYLVQKVFIPANRYYWNEMIEQATGEKLTARYYAKQFVE